MPFTQSAEARDQSRLLRDLLRILEPDLAADLDSSRARRENRSFVPADLRKQESDIIFLVPWRGQPRREVRFVPTWETPFLNLHGTPPETLTRFAGAIGWALRVMQAEKAPPEDLERILRDAMERLEGLSEEQAGQWLRVAWFLLLVMHRREERELGEWVVEQARRSKFGERQQVAQMALTIIEQAEACGEARGKARMLRVALERVLRRRFGELPDGIVAALAAADVATMTAWLDAAATAASPDEIGIPSPD